MITTTQSSSPRHNRRRITTAGLLVMLTLLTLAATQSSAAAQSKVITTIIPSKVELAGGAAANDTFDTVDNVTLTFQTPTLPARAEVVKATLQLSLNNMLRSSDGTVKVNFIGSDKKEVNFGSRSFNINTPGKDNPWQWTTTEVPPALKDLSVRQSGASFALQLVPGKKPNPARQWYSINAASKFRPRLILEYTVPERPGMVQTEGVPATHSPKSFLPSPAGAQFTSRAVVNVWSYTPVFYKSLVYLINQNANANQYQLQALPALGRPPVWSLFLTNPGQHLLLSESSRLYIVGNGQILVYQLDPSNANTVATVVKASAVSGLNPTLAPAVGADGSLYFVNGQEVYGLNPSLQELWKVTLTNTTTSRVTVGPSGQFVYLTSKGAGLVAINAQTGERVPVAADDGGSQSKLADNNNLTFHAPVVIQHPDGTEKIYVAANSAGDGLLADFNNSKTMPGQSTSGTIAADWAPLRGLWSQPIPDQLSPGTQIEPNKAKTIYAVSVKDGQGTLTAIHWLDGTVQENTPKFPVGASSDLLNTGNNGGNLALDQAGNILVWTGTTDVKLYAFTPSGSLVELPLATSSGLTVGSRLAFGSDGTLYAADAGNAASRALRAIVPQYTLVDSSSAAISSPTHLRVDGAVDKATTLSAPGSVFLGNGFIVKRAATLTIKQSKP